MKPADADALPDEAYAAALASLPGLGPRGLRRLLDGGPAFPRSVWEQLVAGRVSTPQARHLATEAVRLDVPSLWRAYVDAGISIAWRGGRGYPAVLAPDAQAPGVLFSLGDPSIVDRYRRVAIVGTRSATRYGLSVAARLGADLASAGVVVVSGLALGIDGAAHEGALGSSGPPRAARSSAAPPVAVVAGSLAAPYPRSHGGLWRRVADAGAVLSEAPLGAADLSWRFPARNRIIASLADVVVVVECHARGGAMHTVQAAACRGIAVGAVPGSVHSPASTGTNALLADGCTVVRDADDVLVALGLAVAGASSMPAPKDAVGTEDGARGAVLEALGWERCSLEEVLRRCQLPFEEVAGALEQLRAAGRVHGDAGWWERT